MVDKTQNSSEPLRLLKTYQNLHKTIAPDNSTLDTCKLLFFGVFTQLK